MKLRKCDDVTVFFTYDSSTRPNTNYYKYPPDTQMRRSWRSESRPSLNPDEVIVPMVNASVISKQCGFVVNTTGQYYNSAYL